MDIERHPDRASTLRWARQIAELLRQRPDRAAAAAVGAAIEQYDQERFQLAILGKAKRGKSTLINALLGRRDDCLAPVDKLPASSAITRFWWADAERAVVHFRNGQQQEIPFSQIREYVTEECNRENVKQVDVVDVAGPFALFDPTLILVDTPGAASIDEHHDALLHGFIPLADAVVFLVSARMPLDEDELELLAALKEADVHKLIFAINRIDELSPEDVEAAKRHNLCLLADAGVPVKTMYETSALRAFRGDWAASGLAELASAIGAYLATHRGEVLQERLVSRVVAAVLPVLHALDVEVASCHRTTDELDRELQSLRDQERTLAVERNLAEREFTRRWTLAVDQLDAALAAAHRDIRVEIGRTIAQTSAFDTSSLARRLPTVLNQSIDERLSSPVGAFERSAREACAALQISYPALAVAESGAVSVRTREDLTFLVGSAGGLAAAAGGAGLALAGSSAATGLAAATTVAAPSVISSLLTTFGLGTFAPLATGTITLATPTMPLWVALAGPVGWTLAGIGALAVPFAWRISKLKARDQLEQACVEQLRQVFERLKSERIPALRDMGNNIVEEYRLQLERELQHVEAAIVAARDKRLGEGAIAQLRELAGQLRALVETELVERPTRNPAWP